MKKRKLLMYALASIIFFNACSKDDNDGNEEETPVIEQPEEGIFVLTGRASAFSGSDVIYTTNTLDSGILITTGKGIEQDGATFNYTVNNGSFFSFMFGQSTAGAVNAYSLNADKQLAKTTSFQTETMTCFGNVGDDILAFKNAWQPEEQYTQWYRIDANTKKIVANGEIDAEALVGNGEKAFFTDVKKVGEKVFAAFMSVENGKTFASAFPDSSYVAVYSYPSMTLEKVIRDGRTGSIGAYWYNATAVDENGDFYALGTKLTPDLSYKYSTATPAGFMKVKNGSTSYDQSYFLNITALSGGMSPWRNNYLGNGYFLLTMCAKPYQYPLMYLASIMGGGVKYAIVNVYDGSFKWVTGAPEGTAVQMSTGSYYYSKMDGTGYVGIYAKVDGKDVSAVYKFDAATATAKQVLTADKVALTSISWVPLK
jgi:hypothetical protein